ncbi:MAG: hypothetical protein JXR68_04995 [Bacteroidales bacterium]|nr:hypothetical protein [Bacteroidales bacterium]
MILKIINNRNTLLILSLLLGLFLGWGVDFLKNYTLYILAVVMVFSTTSFDFKTLNDYKFFAKSTLVSFLLNYIIFGSILLLLAYFLIDEKELFWGFVVIAATPPGVAVIPFSFIFKGNTTYSLVGVLGVYLLAIIASPLIIKLFVQGADIKVLKLVMVTVQVIVIPILLSRLLLFKKIKSTVDKIKGKVVNWGFALIVYTVIGLNKNAIFAETDLLIKIGVIFFVSMFVAGFLFEFLLKKKIKKDLRISQNLMFTIKSSGYAAGTSLAVFGERSALPSAFLAVFVLLYLIVIGFVFDANNMNATI